MSVSASQITPLGTNPSDQITIVMVAHGRADVVRQTLTSLANCKQPAAFAGMILVENGPPCGMAEAIAPFQDQLRITHETVSSPKKTVALNHALKLIGTGWALFIDDDVRVSSDWISLYAHAIAREPKGYYFGGPTACDYEQPPPAWLRLYLPDSARGLQFPEGTHDVRYPSCFLGFNWAADIEALLQAGGFPEQFGPGTPYGGGDESFMQLRLAELGQRGILIPEALVWHQISSDRCTPQWCIKRMYAGGQTAGLEAAWHDFRHPRRLAALRSHARHFKNRVASWPLGDLIRLNEHGRFWIRRLWSSMRGFCHGYRDALQGRPHPEPFLSQPHHHREHDSTHV